MYYDCNDTALAFSRRFVFSADFGSSSNLPKNHLVHIWRLNHMRWCVVSAGYQLELLVYSHLLCSQGIDDMEYVREFCESIGPIDRRP